jgi:hypothetical protein
MTSPFIWVYQYEIPEMREAKGYVRQASYRTEASIRQQGGVVLAYTGRQVPAHEIDSTGAWAPDRR